MTILNGFESWLEEKFINTNEVDGVPITKDNCEDLFSNYLTDLDTQEIIDLANKFGEERYEMGKKVKFETPY